MALMLVTAAWPQASRSTVHDQGQAVVLRAKVTLNSASNVDRATITNESGVFVFRGAFPGSYRLTAESTRVQKYEANLTVLAQQDVNIEVIVQVGQNVTSVDGNPVEIYGYKYPIQDCQGGTCYPGYLWWDGYIPANAPTGTDVSQFWDPNTVWIPLTDGSVQQTTFNDNLNPFRNQYKLASWQRFQDASATKFVTIKARLVFRFSLDSFKVFNRPNNPTAVGANGVLSTRSSGSSARVTQLEGRLAW